MKIISPEMLEKIESNIFPAAHKAVENWKIYPWHTRGSGIDTWQPNSSQALSIDVFGTIMAFEKAEARDAVMNAIAAELGMEPDRDWEIELEWMDEENHLNEPRQTQIDVAAQSSKNLILMECKFTEQDGGSCSQVKPLPKGEFKGIRQCNGSYKEQANPVDGSKARCALTAKGIRYWDAIPEIFDFDSGTDYAECPFKGGWFQWMRNLALCHELAKACNRHGKAIVVYVDSSHMPFKQKMASGDWAEFLKALKKKTLLSTLSYQRVLELGAEALKPFVDERQAWEGLKKHVQDKVAKAESARL